MALPPVPKLLDRERQELVSFILGLFRGPVLASSGFPKAELQGTRGEADLMTDLGDYAPLLAAAGDRETALSFAELTFRVLSASPLVPGLRTRFPRPGLVARILRRVGATHLQDYTKVLLGFVQLHQATGDGRPLSWARWLSQWILGQFGTSRGLASFWIHGRLPAYEPLTATLVEAMLDVATLASDVELRRRALAALDPFLENPVFQATGLCPSWCVPSPRAAPLPLRPLRRIDLAKSNTALASACLRAFQATAEPRYADAARSFLTTGLDALQAKGGGLYTLAYTAKDGIRREGAVNGSNHAAIEVLVEGHRLLRDDGLLRRAVSLGRFWRDLVHPSTGLMPDRVGGTESLVSGNIDFAVMFHKLFDLTSDRAWRDVSETLVAAVARWHRQELGLASRTYVATGAVSSSVIDCASTSLYLKPLLIPHGRSVFSLDVLVSLLRHR